jgi:murein DD-endopeptidase MepM/ murein hydrolase activator NlpD
MNRLFITSLFAMIAISCFGEDNIALRAKNTYVPPFNDGIWFVSQGGDTPNVNHHFAVECQFYGVDLMMTKNRSLNNGTGRNLNDYFSYGQALTSPCNGKIIALMNDAKDQFIGKSEDNNEYGNYVIIDAGNNEYVVLAHMSPGTIIPSMGDDVKTGDSIGKVGNSGNTTMPHIHMHIQTSPVLREGKGLLFEFANSKGVISGRVINNSPLPLIQGMWVENMQPKK